MNILVINGSPKGGRSNTLRLTDAFLQGICDARKDCPPEIERLDISKMDIQPCLGCFSCWKDTLGECCIHDDMQMILSRLLWADLTIWSFPLYYFSLPGKLKTVIDRQLPLTLPFMQSGAEGGGHPSRYDMSGKKTVLISTCGFYTAKSNYDSVTAQFDRILGKGNYTALFCGEGELFRVPELSRRTDEYLAVVRRAGQEYVTGGTRGFREETEEQLQELLFPRETFEKMADASWGVSQTGDKDIEDASDSSLIFTRQMAALYNPAAYPGSDIVFDIDYTDIGKRYRIILGKSESRVLTPEKFEESDNNPDVSGVKPSTVIHTPLSVWHSIAAGEIEGSAALMKHQYSVEGDFNLMLKWDDYFGAGQSTDTAAGSSSTASASSASSAKGKTDMRCLIAPWIVFWIAASIDAFKGSIISVLACCLMPLLFYRRKKTIYDVTSGALVSVFSILLIVHVPLAAVMPLSYLAFGVMWSLSAFLKVPLSAEYSLNDYGGDKALRNPMFITTNRILTAAWGILYLITPIWTWPAMHTAAGSYIGIINSVLPAIMGIFTVWFQRWYPRRIARGKA